MKWNDVSVLSHARTPPFGKTPPCFSTSANKGVLARDTTHIVEKFEIAEWTIETSGPEVQGISRDNRNIGGGSSSKTNTIEEFTRMDIGTKRKTQE